MFVQHPDLIRQCQLFQCNTYKYFQMTDQFWWMTETHVEKNTCYLLDPFERTVEVLRIIILFHICMLENDRHGDTRMF